MLNIDNIMSVLHMNDPFSRSTKLGRYRNFCLGIRLSCSALICFLRESLACLDLLINILL
jgi:hypothetical protein